MENLMFLILNMLFCVILFVFIVSSTSGEAVLRQKYAKEIALMIDEAKPGTTIYIDASELIDRYGKEQGIGIKIDEDTRKVIANFTGHRAYAFNYFTDAHVKLEQLQNRIILTVEKNA